MGSRIEECVVESYLCVLVLIKPLPVSVALFDHDQGFKEGSNSSGNASSCPEAQPTVEGEANTDGSSAPCSSASTLTSCQHQ